MPKLTIDGKEVEVEAGTTVIQAAEKIGISVPHYCWHPGLSIAGNCRMCLVDVEKMPKLAIACSTAAAEGMKVTTTSEKVREARDAIMEFLLINHPLDCPICDQAGECRLQQYSFRYGPGGSRFLEEKVHKPKNVDIGEHIVFDAERCIICTRCVRFCKEVSKTDELTVANRGDHVTIETYPGIRLDNRYSGNTVDICPVGALTLKEFRFQQRVWFLKEVKSICAGCARGCNVIDGISLGKILRMTPRTNLEVNRYWICDEGRLSYEKLYRGGRILRPRVSASIVSGPSIAMTTALGNRSRKGAELQSSVSGGADRFSAPATHAPEAFGLEAEQVLAAGPDLRHEAVVPVPELARPVIPVMNEGVAPAPHRGGPLQPGDTVMALALDAAARALAEMHDTHGDGSVEFLFSSRATNEDVFALGRLARDHFGARRVALPVHERGEDDDLLIRKDKTPNRTGAMAILAGLGLTIESGSDLAVRIGSGTAKAVVALGPNLMGLEIPPDDRAESAVIRGRFSSNVAQAPPAPGTQRAVARWESEGGSSAAEADGDPASDGDRAGAGASPASAETSRAGAETSRAGAETSRARSDADRAGSDADRRYTRGERGLFEALSIAADAADTLIIAIDAFESPLTARAKIVLPALTYGEIEGTVTNFSGRVQRVRAGLAPGGDALPVYRIAQEIARRLGDDPGRTGAQEAFLALAAEIPAFAGLSYGRIGEEGALLAHRADGA